MACCTSLSALNQCASGERFMVASMMLTACIRPDECALDGVITWGPMGTHGNTDGGMAWTLISGTVSQGPQVLCRNRPCTCPQDNNRRNKWNPDKSEPLATMHDQCGMSRLHAAYPRPAPTVDNGAAQSRQRVCGISFSSVPCRVAADSRS
jgi:hypothetical protein